MPPQALASLHFTAAAAYLEVPEQAGIKQLALPRRVDAGFAIEPSPCTSAPALPVFIKHLQSPSLNAGAAHRRAATSNSSALRMLYMLARSGI
jgi:hypothetical protein